MTGAVAFWVIPFFLACVQQVTVLVATVQLQPSPEPVGVSAEFEDSLP